MIKTSQPALHGDQHCPDGSDPIPCLLTAPAAGGTYPDAVLAHPCLVHYWPCDESSGDLVDRKGTWDLVCATADVSGVTYPQYGAAGPFPELPELTAVVNAGTWGVAPDDHGRFSVTYGTLPWVPETAGFSLEFWLYLTAYDPLGLTPTLLNVGQDAVIVNLFNPAGKRLTCGYSGVSVADPSDLPLNIWHHIVVTYDATNVLSLYRNGSLLDTDTTLGAGWGSQLSWLNHWTTPTWSPVNGRGAQLAVYDCALTADEIAGHYELRDTGANAAAGLVLTTDGDGGTDWEFPTVNVDGTRYDEILTGTNLTSSDNSDGTVTIDATGGTTTIATDPIWDTKGDLAAATGADTASKLPVGTNGQILTADSTQTTGIKWAAAPATFDPATATTWWYPLIDSDGLAVLDDSGALIPTLIPF